MARKENAPTGAENSRRENTTAGERDKAQGNTAAEPRSERKGAESAGSKDEDRQLGRAHGAASTYRTSDLSRPNASRAASGQETFGKKHDQAGNPTDELTTAEEGMTDQEDLEIDEDVDTDDAEVQADRDDS
ncbi:MAG: hypothetical protein ABI432_07180 [Flavobacteriales bacterium]